MTFCCPSDKTLTCYFKKVTVLSSTGNRYQNAVAGRIARNKPALQKGVPTTSRNRKGTTTVSILHENVPENKQNACEEGKNLYAFFCLDFLMF